MALLKIVTVPDPILTKKTEPIKTITPEIKQLILDMMAACKKANGIGLAAPQIGQSIRLCIIDLSHLGLDPFPLINPKITKKSWKKITLEEGCLSIPKVFGLVRRPEKITVQALNAAGEKSEFKADGLLARVIQHEVDHLDGILFTSKMTKQTAGQPHEKM